MEASVPTRADRTAVAGRPVVLRPVARPRSASRYRVREIDGVRCLTCVEAPTVAVRLEPGVTVSAAQARSAPPGSIFLDGAAEAEPFADPVRRVYNLDHHEGCVRAFTLSACEQAMVLVRRGLELRSREWTVHANDADLDAILAIWVLFNHLRLSDPADPVRAEIMPLLRLEGAIDAHGLDLQDLCALPPALLDETHRRMDRLRDRERSLKSTHRWHRTDLLEYVRERLAQIDALVYPPRAFDGMVDVEELGRTEIADGSVALACRARVGIYEVERQLRRLHGPRLGLIVLHQRAGVYTVRQVDPTLSPGLHALYAHLNLVDPAAGSPRSGNRWGGSAEIGGSPRRTGSKLSAEQVLEACRHAHAPVSVRRRLAGALRATGAAAAVLAASWLGALAGPLAGIRAADAFGYALLGVAGVAFLRAAARARRVFGLGLPRGTDWVAALPFAVAGGLLAGPGVAGLPPAAAGTPGAGAVASAGGVAVASWLCAVAGAELLFRGVVHGRLVWAFGPLPMARAGREPLWRPAVLAAVLGALAALVLRGVAAPPVPLPEAVAAAPLAGVGMLWVGLAAGLARERSGSVLGAVAVQLVAAAAVLLFPMAGLR